VIIYDKNKETMESIIYNFKNFSEGVHVYSNKTYLTIESPKGEFGLSLISNNKIPNRPYRLKIRSPGFYNLSSLNIICTNYIISDLLAYLSTLDLILGEIDK
jgi:NADH-quinone oxidoreductase subunit D